MSITTVIYTGDDNHTNTTVNTTVIIPKLIILIKVTVTDIDVGQTAIIAVTVPEDATGSITIEITHLDLSN